MQTDFAIKKGGADDDNDEIDMDAGGGAGGGAHGTGNGINSPANKLYIARNRVPPITMCLLYDPLQSMTPTMGRTEWEQKLGGLPAFHVYCMSRAIYSSSSNPLLKPEHFMPEAKEMTATERWKEYMIIGDNPLVNFYVAGNCLAQLMR